MASKNTTVSSEQPMRPIHANSEDLFSLLVFSQGLQGSAEGWEEEGNLVSEANHLLFLFIPPSALFLEETLAPHVSPSSLSVSLSLFPSQSLPDGISSRCW